MDEIGRSPIDSLKNHLAERGPMSVGDYMAWCLTGSEAAYYRSGNPIGASGDFVTAPEVSQIFGELIAIWAYTVWQSMGMPRPFNLAELGPGRGTLMQDALRAARAMPGFIDAAQIHLVETSEALRAKQQQVLSAFCAPNWHQTVQAVPHEPLIVIANEFFDALPVEQHVFEKGSWHRRVVSLNAAGRPAFSTGRLAVPPVELMPPEPPREGDILEHRPSASALIAEFGRRAQSAPVAVLVADYGYERRDYGDTLQAVRTHGYANPLEAPGETDLSAHVNFAELTHAAESAGLNVWGPMPQSEFLLSLGLEARLRVLMSAARGEQRSALFLGARRLVDPFQMGNLFKVMAMTSRDLPPPAPFEARPALRG
ncbi:MULTISPECIES: SAM-dependent methyltransferase [Rhodomicrobium]|uniref:class I SAM-dependent methyltransferase n=1 Tax=Rhodomicrobium TaxID=1068 RepID=UPI000B4B1101|nr:MULTISPECIES: SAM-dependent methyltransferase [Rhodomicrobium]